MDRVKDQQQRQLFKQSTWPEFEGYFILFPHQLSSEAGELPGELSSILHVIGQIFPSHQKVWVRSKSLLDSGRGSFTLSSRISGGRRSRKNGSESSGTLGGQHWKKRHHKVTSQRQFNLKTEVGRHDKLDMQLIPLKLLVPHERKEFATNLLKNMNPKDTQ
ncbi:uncharacterized protein LOC108195570 isoform X1 [Daucus carota subsp. sativus]|nr:PREDICTED: uncharacterized protein LOC108195570 isoform X1 [Daucus carota subsp. sativus]XP_017218045.1 PREDICTED: uncharacterized protein LOC108195570 isoform X1 [Daucus carota subsp. sativus]XP_017218050.1 PREDICTED: uncharacterized protein LOC108195570 isoform X1 [Daucus carota subsp. sativus]XP_017218058.1 PREDICTED: uncharacterized protein LOC108195570 isoform X1 [Daucus carota subsp. sativus]XP_017220678.1 PREDICTED: uncharacterized protein LOC108197541 [Daucus carota subsp. sativus]X